MVCSDRRLCGPPPDKSPVRRGRLAGIDIAADGRQGVGRSMRGPYRETPRCCRPPRFLPTHTQRAVPGASQNCLCRLRAVLLPGKEARLVASSGNARRCGRATAFSARHPREDPLRVDATVPLVNGRWILPNRPRLRRRTPRVTNRLKPLRGPADALDTRPHGRRDDVARRGGQERCVLRAVRASVACCGRKAARPLLAAGERFVKLGNLRN